jgi:hypothetical protein
MGTAIPADVSGGFCGSPEERSQFEITGSSVHWPDLDVDVGVEGLLAGAREHHHYARKAVERAVRLGRLPKSPLQVDAPSSLEPAQI